MCVYRRVRPGPCDLGEYHTTQAPGCFRPNPGGASRMPLCSSHTPTPAAKPVDSIFKIQIKLDHLSPPSWLPPQCEAELPAPGLSISPLTGPCFCACPPKVLAPHT